MTPQLWQRLSQSKELTESDVGFLRPWDSKKGMGKLSFADCIIFLSASSELLLIMWQILKEGGVLGVPGG